MSAQLSSSHPAPSRAQKVFTRRGLLGLIGAAGAGFLAAPKANAFATLMPTLNVDDLTHHMMPLTETLLPGAEEYARFLSSLCLRHVTVPLVLDSHAKQHNGVKNSLPPTELWSNLVGPLRVVDALCARLQEDVLLVASAYRTPQYNALCPGSAKNSQHLLNGALDLIFKTDPSHVAQVVRELRADGLFHGGIGQYQTFTHIDTRGENVDWCP